MEAGYGSPRWSAEIADCSMPMTFDQYSMCGYGCLYCFAVYQKSVGVAKKNFLNQNLRSVNIPRVKRYFTEDISQFTQYIREKRVFQWGSMADPFCPIEKKHGKGLELLRYFRELDYPIRFSTKGTWWLDDSRYTELFKNNPKWTVMFSIITGDESKSHVLERGCPTPSERIIAIRKASKLNCARVILRLRPFMIGISDPSHMALIRRSHAAGAEGVSTEMFCFESRNPVLKNNLETINRLAGFDYSEFYKKYSVSLGYLRLNRNVKRKIFMEMKELCDSLGMKFWVSDAHFKELSCSGSCCGVPEDVNYCRGQFAEALQIAKRNGRVTWPEVEAGGLEYLKTFLYHKADGFNTGSSERRADFREFRMYDYVRWLWNNPRAGQSPYTLFEGIMKPVAKDKKGDLIYEYDSTRA